MTDNITLIGDAEEPTVTGETQVPVKQIIQHIPLELDDILVLGFRHDGKLYAASSRGEGSARKLISKFFDQLETGEFDARTGD